MGAIGAYVLAVYAVFYMHIYLYIYLSAAATALARVPPRTDTSCALGRLDHALWGAVYSAAHGTLPHAWVSARLSCAPLLLSARGLISFVGSEAPKVLEHLEMVMHLLNYTASTCLESEAAAEGGWGVPDDDVDGWTCS